ncbi:50S ribosomal protein L21 [Hoeflea sp. WL0058]|uniref:Large ribosomal subunit protein bL21 n=1 Tax=Flavimaribacter sediminis TaxID=2865987 RepID=A0AAE2ZPZ9_9HYPH|nr:50S ribosomal protein L21 [Flavimaribacter sediminis]MBW8638622.1 50S ribosomal protein L21 [Flavimaribacter sediminis]
MFAVIKTGGKQYTVSADDLLKVEKLTGETGDTVEFGEVLMVGEGADATIGTPFVDGAMVTAEVVEQGRARKVIAFKKRRRQNSKRTRGHRQHETTIRISEILTGGAKPSKKAAAKKADSAPKAEAKAAPKKEEAKAESAVFTTPEGEPDDLKKISGVGPALEKKLHAAGVTQFAQIAAFSKEDIAKLDDTLNFKGRIERDDWLGQAKALAEEAKK